ncbi:hypothetical protein B0H15DRAFT_259912 [Mycena belliarum]|uniref:Uncharacterized protein n=1 Tax=Mycena belliarum TaxID=1033014 RepID=A0AAD6XSQ6_9AGAR|nr:hypothetical protein B0H15DRAFT_259912 [Mycena belliae]
MSQKALTRYLPLVLFPVLSALALKLTLGNLDASGLNATVEDQCPAHPLSPQLTPHRMAYVGIPFVDKALCSFVTLFHLALTHQVLPFLTYFLGTSMSLFAIPAFEACRNGRHSLLAFPIVFGLLMQVMTMGAVLPIYWLIFILTGAAQRHPGGGPTHISSAHAQAVVFGLIIGVAIPSICLIVLQDSYVTALWQLFPLWQFLAQSAHLTFRRPSAHPDSGYSWVSALYLGAFIISSSTHLGTMAKAKTFAGMKAFFLPSVTPLTSAAPNMQALDLFQWDAVFAFISTLLGTMWFARNGTQAICIALWNVIGSFVVGPGAVIAIIALWREAHLHSSTNNEKEKEE